MATGFAAGSDLAGTSGAGIARSCPTGPIPIRSFRGRKTIARHRRPCSRRVTALGSARSVRARPKPTSMLRAARAARSKAEALSAAAIAHFGRFVRLFRYLVLSTGLACDGGMGRFSITPELRLSYILWSGLSRQFRFWSDNMHYGKRVKVFIKYKSSPLRFRDRATSLCCITGHGIAGAEHPITPLD